MRYTMKDLTRAFDVTPPTVYAFINGLDTDFISKHKVKENNTVKYDDEIYKLLESKYGNKDTVTPTQVIKQDDETTKKLAKVTEELEAIKKEQAERELSILREKIDSLEKRISDLEEEKRTLQQQNGELLFIIRTKEEKEKALLPPSEEERKRRKWFFGRSKNK